MNILLVYPQYPDSFWSFKHALKFVSKKASFPPLGLLTVAAMLPLNWSKKLINMNVENLLDEDIKWADFVFISAMSIQSESTRDVIKRCNELNVKIVAGGPLFTASYKEFEGVDYFVLNEAEITLPEFLHDLKNGTAQPVYTTEEFADIRLSPLPVWELVDQSRYTSMNLQFSRGCPFDCDFCDITVLLGRVPRTKTGMMIINELEGIFLSGWKGPVFFVDDNFIGNKNELKIEVLPLIIEWMEKRNYPFSFQTEASINLADDNALMSLMIKAGFDTVFVGIETPNKNSLEECSKYPNKNRDLIKSIKIIQEAGLEVQGGFIVGFDMDTKNIFEEMRSFIQESGIVTAMVGLLNAPKNTKLFKRLQKENRLINSFTGSNTDFSINFIPKMNREELIEGYKKLLVSLYSPKPYYTRVLQFLKDYNPVKKRPVHFDLRNIKALIKSMFFLGVIGKERYYYWKLFFWSLFRKPELFSLAITYAIYGSHFRKVFID